MIFHYFKPFVILVFVALFPTLIHAAEISIQSKTIKLSGPIEQGDLNKLQAIVKDASRETGLFSEGQVSLNSDGGNFSEGLAIAKFIHEKEIATLVESDSRCYSACAIAFLGGFEDAAEAGRYVNRKMEIGGKLGFHAPYVNIGTARTNVDDLVQAIIATTVELTQWYEKFDVPVWLAPHLFISDKQHSLFLIDTVEKAQALKIQIPGMDHNALNGPFLLKKLTRTMAVNNCLAAYRILEGFPSNTRQTDLGYLPDLELEFGHIRNDGNPSYRLTPTSIFISGGLDGETPVNCETSLDGSCIIFQRESVVATCPLFNTALMLVPPDTPLENHLATLRKLEEAEAPFFPGDQNAGVGLLANVRYGVICNRDASFANMREAPSPKTASVSAKLKNGQRIEIADHVTNPDTGHPWLKIIYKDVIGYVDAEKVAESCG